MSRLRVRTLILVLATILLTLLVLHVWAVIRLGVGLVEVVGMGGIT